MELQDCVGAIDGTLIHACINVEKQQLYRCRKGYTAQNVMAACDHDMRFVYVLAGYEGSAHDAAVFESAVMSADSSFPMPPDGAF